MADLPLSTALPLVAFGPTPLHAPPAGVERLPPMVRDASIAERLIQALGSNSNVESSIVNRPSVGYRLTGKHIVIIDGKEVVR